MSDMMTFPNTVEEFMEQYKIVDTEKIYTNGAELVPIFRIMQWFEHVSAIDKNADTTDCISRQAAIDLTIGLSNDSVDFVRAGIKALPPAQPEPCEDAVSREEVLNCLEWQYPDKTPRTKIMELPPVTPKQRTGYWYPVCMAEAVGGESAQWGSAIAYHRCSECDEQALRDDFEQEVLSRWCPHCGVKMVGVSE